MDKILAKVGALTVSEREVDEFLAELGQRGQGYNTPGPRRARSERSGLQHPRGQKGYP